MIIDKIILDTDFLINIAKNKIRLDEECLRILDKAFAFYIIDKTLDELKGKKEEKLVKEIINKQEVNIIKTKKDKIVDELILENSDNNCIIATQDKELKEKAKKKGLKTLIVRQKKYLELI